MPYKVAVEYWTKLVELLPTSFIEVIAEVVDQIPAFNAAIALVALFSDTLSKLKDLLVEPA